MKRDNAYLLNNKFAVGAPANKTAFQKGNVPWNTGLKGWAAPGTEKTRFKKGQPGRNWVPVGTVKIRQRKNRNESPRAFIKVSEPNVWKYRAVYVWEQENGPIPLGCVIHHKDRNSLNDVLGNLEMMTRAEHLAEHRSEHIRIAPPKKQEQDTLL